MPRIVKDCFGTVISTLNKMKECVRCELLSECRSLNWSGQEETTPPVVMRRPPTAEPQSGDGSTTGGGATDLPN